MTEDKFTVFEFGYGGEYTISGIDATFKNKRDAERVCDRLNWLTEDLKLAKTNQKILEEENRDLKEHIYCELDEIIEFLKNQYDDMNFNESQTANTIYNRLKALQEELE